MTKSIFRKVLIIIIILVTSCQSKDKKSTIIEVKNSGALRTIMSGNIEPVIRLDSLSSRKHLYALGAVENLNGEIQIFDGVPSNSYVVDGSLRIRDSYNLKAALLVYAEVEAWNSFQISTKKSKNDLETIIFETAKNNGINVEKPFPFLLKGTVATIDWHVINWIKGDTIHSHKKHKDSGLNGTLKNPKVEIIGFYSSKHKAVFTHHTSNMHMHFKTENKTIAGHIDDLMLKKNITLKLPKQ
jgi:acetolactate decarboxylase